MSDIRVRRGFIDPRDPILYSETEDELFIFLATDSIVASDLPLAHKTIPQSDGVALTDQLYVHHSLPVFDSVGLSDSVLTPEKVKLLHDLLNALDYIDMWNGRWDLPWRKTFYHFLREEIVKIAKRDKELQVKEP